MTTVTQLRGREEAVNLLHLHTVLACKILQLADELAVGEVGHLATPQRGHARELQVFDADGIEAAAEVVRQLPLPVVAAVGDEFLHAVLRTSCSAAVVAAFLFLRQTAVGGALHAESLIQVARRLDALARGECHVGLQSEVDTDGCTIMCLSDELRGLVEYHDDEELSEVVPLDGEGLDLPIIRTAQRELEAFLDTVNGQDVSIQGIAALFEYYRGEILGLAKLRWTLGQMLKEPLIGGIEPL